MAKRKTIYIASLVIVLLLVAGLIALRQEKITELWHSLLEKGDSTSTWLADTVGTRTAPQQPEPQVATHPPLVRTIPKPDDDMTRELPPSPPLPQVPEETNQEQRKDAFGLTDSVDHVLLREEPFEVNGKTLTIDRIQSDLRGTQGQPGPAAAAQAGGKESPYYAVRVVRPSENIWKIHFGIVREYLARRQVILPLNADQRLPGGRSSGVGRLLKFIESVVTVYNVNENRMEKNINVIYPDSIVIFFKISDLFKALDKLQSDDWKWLRYVKGSIRLDRPQERMELLDRSSLAE